MFHYSNYGKYSTTLQHLSDKDGYVPEPGDDVLQFSYEGDMTPDEWSEHLDRCVDATLEADRALCMDLGYKRKEGGE